MSLMTPNDLADLAGGMLNLRHRRDCALYDGAGVFGGLAGLGRGRCKFVGVLRGALNRRGDLVDGGCGFFERAGLLLGARGSSIRPACREILRRCIP